MRYTTRDPVLPHEGIYTRLGCSEIHGVGVFAIRDIPKGSCVFRGDSGNDLIWVQNLDLTSLDPVSRKLYEDFAVILKDDHGFSNGVKYGVPWNFDRMTSSWYINHSDTPNLKCKGEYDYLFYTLRDIATGEELTVDYRTYSEMPDA